ncbi:MAG: aconitase family protein, partial [Gemmatimonadota bacterium]
IALPTSPGNVVPVREVAGKEIYQAYLGSSANPGFRDFAVPAMMVEGRQVHPSVSFDVNPTSRQILENLTRAGYLESLIHAGARIHQAGCNGCIGMGQAPATGRISLRTVPRNFPGRSGTKEDAVHLCSPETATASALTGKITDPRDLEEELGMSYPVFEEPDSIKINTEMFIPPSEDGQDVELVKGPNITSVPELEPLAESLSGPVLMKVGDDISTDEILPAGTQVLPFRSNIEVISQFTFYQLDDSYSERALAHQDEGHFIVGGSNYGQGSSREHAALAPRYLGVRAVIARSYARIHAQNLVNFGVLPLIFEDPADHESIDQGDELELPEVRSAVEEGRPMEVVNRSKNERYEVDVDLSDRQKEMVLAGSILALYRD